LTCGATIEPFLRRSVDLGYLTLATDPNPALRAELTAALAVLGPQLRGLADLSNLPKSQDLKSAIDLQISARERRRKLLQNVIDILDDVLNALKELEGDGYPKLDNVLIDDTILQELEGEVSDLEIAAHIFEQNVATSIAVNLGSATEKEAEPPPPAAAVAHGRSRSSTRHSP
jgi:hypothetical protein